MNTYDHHCTPKTYIARAAKCNYFPHLKCEAQSPVPHIDLVIRSIMHDHCPAEEQASRSSLPFMRLSDSLIVSLCLALGGD